MCPARARLGYRDGDGSPPVVSARPRGATELSCRPRGATELSCRPRGAGDLVVFHPPESFYVSKGDTPPTSERAEVTLVKRVVALGGDVIEVAPSTPPSHMLTAPCC